MARAGRSAGTAKDAPSAPGSWAKILDVATALVDYARAVPLNALTAYGFGPLGRPGTRPAERLASLRQTSQGAWAALDTAGVTERRLLTVVAALGGSATRSQLAFQTSAAAPGVITSALERLEAAGLVVVGTDGHVELTPTIRDQIPGATISMADPQATTSEDLARICSCLGLRAANRKQERIDAIAATYADPAAAERIRNELSQDARVLLDRIVAAAGPGTTRPEAVGVNGYLLRSALPPRYGTNGVPPKPEVAALYELTGRGIVGVAAWEHELWIWREAWPFVGRPFVTDWSTKPDPKLAAVDVTGTRVPAVVGVLDQAMRAWATNPPAALKNGEARIAKAEVRATAKALGADEALVDLGSRLAISIGLLLRNVAGRSGRGRTTRIDEVWLGDPAMVAAWEVLAPPERWVRLVAEWCSPAVDCGQQLLVNRHLVLWELSQQPEGRGYADADEFAAWFHHRYASLAHPDAALECVRDLRALGVVTPGPVALTALGRAVLDDPASVGSLVAGAADSVTVQADMTVIAPADLRHDLATGLEAIATTESASAATIYRLDAARITRAVQGGQEPSAIVDFLAGISVVPLPDTVVRLVHDAATKAGQVRVIAAPTVVVVSDPADLVTACAIKALKLTRVTDTVAVTDVAMAKVRAALERRGLAPEAVVGAGVPKARSSAAEAEAAAQQASQLRAVARGGRGSFYEVHARELEARAKALGDVSARLTVSGPLTVTPGMLDRLGAGA